MTGSDEMDPGRLDELIAGARPADAAERDAVALIEAVRDAEPGAPARLRERVAAIADGTAPSPPRRARASRWREWIGGGDRRRRLLIAAPVAIALVAGVAVALPALTGSGDPDTTIADSSAGSEGARDAGAADSAAPAPAQLQSESAAPERAAAPSSAPVPKGTAAPTADPNRRQVVRARTEVRVADVEALSRASRSAMGTVRALGGHTVSSDYDVPNGSTGTNRLVVKVPVARVGRAVEAFGRLGTVIGQSADITDVTDQIAAQATAADRLEARITQFKAQIAARPDDAALARALADAQAQLRAAQARLRATGESARMATIDLTLTTENPPPPPASEGRFSGPLGRAGDRLADALAWILAALVLALPFALVIGGAGWAALRMRRRAAARLMSSS
ncbi:MAG: DUF4349 domain-containing protein [Thermoleophilia bacterium]